MCNKFKCISQLYSATRPGACEALKVRAVHQRVRSGVEHGFSDACECGNEPSDSIKRGELLD